MQKEKNFWALEYMTWPQAEKAFREAPLVLIPLGARTKEHGHHLPLNNDWILAEKLTEKVMEHLGPKKVIAIPTVQYSFYPAFLEYPGSISLSLETAAAVVFDICTSLARYGVKKFYVLNTGVSTNRALNLAKEKLAEQDVSLEYTNLLAINSDVEKEVSTQEGGSHADEIETSMMLFLAPEIVKMELAQKDYQPSRGSGLTRDPNNLNSTWSATGVWGDPTLATAEKGKKVVAALVENIVSEVETFIHKI